MVNRRGFLRALIGVTLAPLLPSLPSGYGLSSNGVIVPDAGSLLATIHGDEALLKLLNFRGDGLVELLTSSGTSLLQLYSSGGLWFEFGRICPVARPTCPLIVKAPAGSCIQLAYEQAGEIFTKSWTTA